MNYTIIQHVHTLILDIFSYLQTWITLQCYLPKLCKNRKLSHALASFRSKAWPKRQKYEKVLQAYTLSKKIDLAVFDFIRTFLLYLGIALEGIYLISIIKLNEEMMFI